MSAEKEETKAEARRRNKKELAAQGIKLGLRTPRSAKVLNRTLYKRTGVCLVCHKHIDDCICDDRSDFVKKRI